METLLQLLWSESFWFPNGHSWKDLTNDSESNIYLPQAKDLLLSLPIGLLLFFIRFIYEHYLMAPLGYWMGVKNSVRQHHVKQNDVLEKHFKRNETASQNQLKLLSKKTSMEVRSIEQWLRKRKLRDIPSDIKRFQECGWHFIFYISSFTYGLIVLWNKPWFWETKYCWKDWPKLDVALDIYWYYLMEISFYWCLVLSLFTEHKRKDFYQMIVHHIVTIMLIYFSWSNNFVRIGTLVLIAHDAADFPMALSKMMKYCGYAKACEVFLIIFMVVWVLSRLIYFPFVVVYSTSVEVYEYLQPFPAYYLFNGLLIVLQILHIIWSYMIARIALHRIHQGEVNDVRSESEESEYD